MTRRGGEGPSRTTMLLWLVTIAVVLGFAFSRTHRSPFGGLGMGELVVIGMIAALILAKPPGPPR